jgi:hypothetical protein
VCDRRRGSRGWRTTPGHAADRAPDGSASHFRRSRARPLVSRPPAHARSTNAGRLPRHRSDDRKLPIRESHLDALIRRSGFRSTNARRRSPRGPSSGGLSGSIRTVSADTSQELENPRVRRGRDHRRREPLRLAWPLARLAAGVAARCRRSALQGSTPRSLSRRRRLDGPVGRQSMTAPPVRLISAAVMVRAESEAR